MVDDNKSPVSGIQFNLSNLASVSTPQGLAQQSVGAALHAMPTTSTPLSDPFAAGVAGSIVLLGRMTPCIPHNIRKQVEREKSNG